MSHSHYSLSSADITRYSRHILIPDVGLQGQKRIRDAKVLVIGAGGLGSPALMYLAAAGVGTLGICDFDAVDSTNLQRQVIHNEHSIDTNKAESAARFVRKLNASIKVTVHDTLLNEENILSIFSQYDVILDACDNFKTRYLISDTCVSLGKLCVFGSVFQIEGQVTVFDNTQDGFCYRDLFPTLPPDEVAPKGSVIGIWGPLCGVIGSMMAGAALQAVLGQPSLMGSLLVFNAMDMDCRLLSIAKNRDKKISTEIHHIDAANTNNKTTLKISTHDADKWLQGNGVLLDIRSEQEREICSIPDSMHFPQFKLAFELPPRFPEFDVKLMLYCKDGARSEQAAQQLSAMGYRNVSVLEGGILAWLDINKSRQARY